MSTKTKDAPQTTSLTVIPKDSYLALRDGSEVREALDANIGSGEGLDESMLVRVPTPAGGGTRWAIPDPINEDTAEITGVLVLVVPRGVLWPSDEPGENALPVLVSHDLKTARQVGPIPDDMLAVLERHKIGDR